MERFGNSASTREEIEDNLNRFGDIYNQVHNTRQSLLISPLIHTSPFAVLVNLVKYFLIWETRIFVHGVGPCTLIAVDVTSVSIDHMFLYRRWYS